MAKKKKKKKKIANVILRALLFLSPNYSLTNRSMKNQRCCFVFPYIVIVPFALTPVPI